MVTFRFPGLTIGWGNRADPWGVTVKHRASRLLFVSLLALGLMALLGPAAALAAPAVTFTAAGELPAHPGPICVVSADFNGDGREEVLASNSNYNSFELYTQQGWDVLHDQTLIPAAGSPDTAVAADVNRDGKLDIVVALTDSDRVGVLLGQGGGSFDPMTETIVGDAPRGLAVGDVNRDGKLDVVCTSDDGGIYTLLGDGTGGFPNISGVASGATPGSVTLADLNADGWLDAAVACRTAGWVGVHLNSGGSFGSRVAWYPTATRPWEVRAGDMDRDGDLDLVTANMGGSDGACTTLLNDGSGGFATAVAIDDAVGRQASNLALSDVDGDGVLDIAISDPYRDELRVYRGTGDGAAVEATTITQVDNAYAILLSDLDRDGLPDLGAASYSDTGTVRVWRNSTNVARGLGFASAETTGTSAKPRTVEQGDFDRDGTPDLLVCDQGTVSGDVRVLFGDGTGGVRETKMFGAGSTPYCARFEDMNRDGWLDIVVADFGLGRVIVLPNNHKGGVGSSLWVETAWPAWVDTGDVNGDGAPDAITAAVDDHQVRVLINDGAGNLSAGPILSLQAGAYGPKCCRIADLNRDGRADIVSANVTGSGSVWLGQEGGTFSSATAVSTGSSPLSVDVADIDGDGRLDLAFANSGSASLTVRFGDGSGTGFGPATTVSTADSPAGVRIADMNRDGRPDLVISNQGATRATVFLNKGGRTFAAQPGIWLPGYSWNAPCVVDLNRDGTPDLVESLFDADQAGIVVGAPTATPGVIRGTVYFDGYPKSGITVQIDGLPAGITPSDGTYWIPLLSAGTHTVTFSRTNYATQSYDLEVADGATVVKDINITLAPATFFGTVTAQDTGGPLAGVAVRVGDVALGFNAVTGADGTFSIPGIPPATYDVYFSKAGYSDHVGHGFTVYNGATAYNPEMVPAPAKLKGIVTRQSDGAPLSGVWVKVGDLAPTTTGEDGAYELWDIPEGAYRVEYYKSEYATHTIDSLTFSRATTVTQDVSLRALDETVTAMIDSPTAGTSVAYGTAIHFSGHMASDTLGHSANGYAWRTDTGGALSASPDFWVSLPVGVHTVYFKVRCANGQWSAEQSVQVVVQKIVATGTMPKVSGKATAKKGTTLTGAVAPGRATRVTIEVQVYSKKKYRAHKKYAVTSTATGAWKYKAKLKKGTYRIRMRTDADATYLEAVSGWRKVTVK